MENRLNGLLKQYYGYDSFRPGQEEVISSLINGRDCLSVMPTGSGKSLIFQMSALIFDGITLVISPLISLMRDQVAALKQNGVPAAFINSSLTSSQTEKALERAKNGAYKIIYVAPERLELPSFLNFANEADVSFVAVDEAHCVSHWGQDFRPSYLAVCEFVKKLPKRPVLGAFTATATDIVKDDIVRFLELETPFILATGFNRENLYFEVRHPGDKYAELAAYLQQNDGKSGIIYCATRKTVDELTKQLNEDGFSAVRYHAGMFQNERTVAQDDFVYDRIPIIVATNAFGMGIDKSNVSFVIHYNMPKNMESYYQEAGRAGRDGTPADCILMFSTQDIVINRFLIDKTDPDSPLSPDELAQAKALDYKRLRQMEHYCKTTDCLRQYILDYFSDNIKTDCDNCGNCRTERKTVDVTQDAQKILSCVHRLNGRFGITIAIDVLRGSKNEKITRAKLHELKSYGIMADNSIKEIRRIVDFLVQRGYISVTDGQYPIVGTTEAANDILFNSQTVLMPIFEEADSNDSPHGKRAKKKAAERKQVDAGLFESLRELRKKLAEEESVPAFVIFSDATLFDMCAKLPAGEEDFLDVSGVGQVKLNKYGAAFLEVINEYKSSGAEINPHSDAMPCDVNSLLEQFEFSDSPVPISEFMDKANIILMQTGGSGTSAQKITNMLFADGYLKTQEFDGRATRVPSEKGEASGISCRTEQGQNGREYMKNYYDSEAQRLLLKYFERIIKESF